MSATQKIISTGYEPRRHQVEMHQNMRRFSLCIMHRRFGKSVFAINTAIHRALTCKLPNPRVFYLAPNYGQAKRIIWDYAKQFTALIPNVEYNEAELRIDIPHNKSRIQLLSAENPAALKGVYSDLVVLDEYGDMSPVVWSEAVRPTLADRKGSALFVGTVKGQNHFWEMYEQMRDANDPEWYTKLFKASETGIISDEELASMRKTMSDEAYASEMECDPLGGLIGAYFSKEMSRARVEGRVGNVPHDPMIPVDTYWDLGMNDAMSVWFAQSVHKENRIIDYYEATGLSIPEVLADIHNKKRYKINSYCLPHDAQVREMSTGRSRIQMFYSLGCRNVRVIPKVGTKMESINAARVMIDSCWFDEQKCKLGIKALDNYKKKFNEALGTFSETPLHDKYSNGADAFQQFAMGQRGDSRDSGQGERRYANSRGEMLADMEFNPYDRSG